MKPLHETCISTAHGDKKIAVYCCNVLDFDEEIDILTTSAFRGSYARTPGTVFAALGRAGISVWELSMDPVIDLRQLCNVWLSSKIASSNVGIHRIGCIEMAIHAWEGEQMMLNSIKAYFQMLDIAATYDIKMDTVALPLLGAGNQQISASLTMIPILNECVAFLRRNSAVKRICFIEINLQKALLIAESVRNSYMIAQENANASQLGATRQAAPKALAFISYASPDKNIADNLCAKLEEKGIKAWYAPRDVVGPYAEAITNAIGKATHFIVILSQNSMQSQHVLNEIDLAFQSLPDKIKFKPLRIDESLFTPSFKYYLSRQHWQDATSPPLEARLEEFVDSFVADL